MRSPSLNADLADPHIPAATASQGRLVPAHERVQLLHGRVLATDLAYFTTDRHRNTRRLVLADEGRKVGGELAIDGLLFLECRLLEIDQRGSIDIDVVK